MDLESTLKRWGVDEESIQSLKDQRMTVEALKALTDDELKEVVPFMGPRVLIRQNLAQLSSGSGSNESGMDDSRLSSLLQDIVHDSRAMDTVENEAPQSKRIRTSDDQAKTSDESAKATNALEALLQRSSTKGEMVLAEYQNHSKLSDTGRSRLAAIIVSEELRNDLNKRITGERAKNLASQVKELFPTEVLSVWYREEMRPNGEGKISKGRILTKYYNDRRNMIKFGLINKSSFDDDNDDYAVLDEDDPDNCEESNAWLRGKNVSPWPQVQAAWQATSKLRLRKLQTPSQEENNEPSNSKSRGRRSRAVLKKKKVTQGKVVTYLKEYPQLLQPLGWELLSLDFDTYQPDASFKLTAEYPKLERFVQEKLRRKNGIHLDDSMSSDIKVAHVFLAFAKLIPVITIAYNQTPGAEQPQWRLSRQDIKDSFLLHLKAEGALQGILKARREKLIEFGFSTQPQAVIISKDLEKIDKCYICTDSHKYELPTPLQLMDTIFKLYHAVHADYPVESFPLWTFLQRAVYKFKTKWDDVSATAEALITEYAEFE